MRSGFVPRGAAVTIVCVTLGLLAGCAGMPPKHQDNLCRVLSQHPEWYDYAMAAEERWGVPAQILFAFIKFESGYRAEAAPPRDWFLGIIPLPRDSSAFGYAQAKDATWNQYLEETDAGWFTNRDDMEDALDFVGWYNHKSHELLGISVWDPKHLYLAYHEGWSGYRSGAWRNDADLKALAGRVDRLARRYGAQLNRCEDRFQCDAWYQFWPFCAK